LMVVRGGWEQNLGRVDAYYVVIEENGVVVGVVGVVGVSEASGSPTADCLRGRGARREAAARVAN